MCRGVPCWVPCNLRLVTGLGWENTLRNETLWSSEFFFIFFSWKQACVVSKCQSLFCEEVKTTMWVCLLMQQRSLGNSHTPMSVGYLQSCQMEVRGPWTPKSTVRGQTPRPSQMSANSQHLHPTPSGIQDAGLFTP